jgi:hypothetical protein
MKSILIFSILIFSFFYTSACSCSGLKELNSTNIEEANAIFIGKVLTIVPYKEGWKKEVTFEVLKNYKGVSTKDTITISTRLDESACGLSTDLGETWYIFAYKNKNGVLTASYCGRSVNTRFRNNRYGRFKKKIYKNDIKILKDHFRL